MSYLAWQDGTKKPVREKIEDVIAAYRDFFRTEPVECLCHPSHEDALTATPASVPVRFVSYVTPAYFYCGEPDEPAEVNLR